MLVFVGNYGHYAKFADQMVKILDYRPLELAIKLEQIFKQEFDRISYYDLIAYSEITKSLLVVFKDSDQNIIDQEKGIVSDASNEDASENQEEEKVDSKKSGVTDPAKLAAQLLKKQSTQKKGAATAAKGGKVGATKKSQTTKPVQKEED